MNSIDICVWGTPVVSLIPGEGRVKLGLVMPAIDRVVDVTVQPSAVCAALQDGRGHVPGGVDREARRALADAAGRFGSWRPPSDQSLLAGFGGAAYPLLASAYENGALPVGEVPRWAVPLVEAPSAREGATALFEARTTRPVVRGVITALAPVGDGLVDFSTLALAMIGRDVLDPDRLARVLSTERVVQPETDLPDPAELEAARRTVNRWGAVRAERVLTDAASTAGGVKLLMDTVRYVRQLSIHGPATLPNRLSDFHDVHRALIATQPPEPAHPWVRPRVAGRRAGPPAPAAPEPAAAATPAVAVNPDQPGFDAVSAAFPGAVVVGEPAPRRRPVAAPGHAMFGAPLPTSLRRATEDTTLQVSPDMASLNGRMFGDVSFVVPRVVADLTRWGRLLRSCIGDFGQAMAEGQTTVLGVEQRGQLVGAIEITRSQVIQQFTCEANRRPSRSLRRTVVRALLSQNIIDRHHPSNRDWIREATLD